MKAQLDFVGDEKLSGLLYKFDKFSPREIEPHLSLYIVYILWKLKLKLADIEWFANRSHTPFLNSLAKTYNFLRSKNFKENLRIQTLSLVEIFVLNLVSIWSYHNWIVVTKSNKIPFIPWFCLSAMESFFSKIIEIYLCLLEGINR